MQIVILGLIPSFDLSKVKVCSRITFIYDFSYLQLNYFSISAISHIWIVFTIVICWFSLNIHSEIEDYVFFLLNFQLKFIFTESIVAFIKTFILNAQ